MTPCARPGGKQRAVLDAAGSAAYSGPTMFAHLTPLEAPVIWLAFGAGLAVGIVGTWLTLRRRIGAR